ncbi:MAG: hypothetical protein KME09_14405 [Pleurocapsa minor HA4230-MV1]|jgi:hypothetical protein|nr:hypothetical protein [Pleurocapsa minor HA4230-MV1]
MHKSQLISAQMVIFDTLLDNLLLQLTISFSCSCNIAQAHACIDTLSTAITTVLDIGLPQPLQQFKEQLPNIEDRVRYELFWCEFEYLVWIEELKTAVAIYRNTQFYWHFNNQEILKLYYDANKLLIDCLEHNFELTIELQQEIETALLFPDKKLPKKQYTEDKRSLLSMSSEQ